MKIDSWSSLRLLTLWLLCFSVVGTLGRLLFFPLTQTDNRPFLPRVFTFPDQVELVGWRSLPSRPIHLNQVSTTARPKFLSGQVYQYQHGDRLLTIDMVYTIETNGNLVNFLDGYTDLAPSVVRSPASLERFHNQSGHYLLFEHDQSIYLASCINPRGKSTITLDQFQRNRYLNDFRPERLIRWFFRSESMRDLRCLWTHMSIPLDGDQPDQVFLVLEDSWLIWHDWWQDHFPKL